MELVRLVDGPIAIEPIVESIHSLSRGAVVLFVGCVRDRDRGRPVTGLTYDAYRPMARERLLTIVEELAAEAPDLVVAIHHRLGDVAAGEASVVIATAAPHRDAAYAASRTALERLKTEVPIWKHERYADGSAAWREDEKLI